MLVQDDAVFSTVALRRTQSPLFQISCGAEEAELAALQLEGHVLERDESFSRIVPGPAGGYRLLELETIRRWRTPESLLLPIGEAMAQLVCAEDFSNVKACEGHPCTLFFADHTRGRARRWCSMAICGNRAKQATHRQRARAHRGSIEDLGC